MLYSPDRHLLSLKEYLKSKSIEMKRCTYYLILLILTAVAFPDLSWQHSRVIQSC
jgi:hypothetical protein